MLKKLIAVSTLVLTTSMPLVLISPVDAESQTANLPEATTIAKINVGVLKANDPNSRINLREKPTTNSKALGYGLTGDGVEIIGCSSEFGDTWLEVKFIRPPHATGWVRADFILTSISLEYC